MALLDKLGNLMENVAEKTSELVEGVADKTQNLAEIAKLNGRIAEENNRISALKLSMSNTVYGRYERMEEIDEELISFCRQIEEHLGVISDLQAEVVRLKGEPPAPQSGTSPYKQGSAPTAACPACGKTQPEDAKFCTECGARMGAESAPVAEQPEE